MELPYEGADDGSLPPANAPKGPCATGKRVEPLAGLWEACDTGGDTIVEYLVDPTGRRIGRFVPGESEAYYLYRDALNPVALLDDDHRLVQRYVYATSAHAPEMMISYEPATGTETGRFRFATDVRGSVRQVVDAETGDAVHSLSYDRWGIARTRLLSSARTNRGPMPVARSAETRGATQPARRNFRRNVRVDPPKTITRLSNPETVTTPPRLVLPDTNVEITQRTLGLTFRARGSEKRHRCSP